MHVVGSRSGLLSRRHEIRRTVELMTPATVLHIFPAWSWLDLVEFELSCS